MKPTYTKLIMEAGKLIAVPADYAERHELVRVDHPLLAQPLIVTAYMTPGGAKPYKKAIAAAAKHTVYGQPIRAMEVEEAFLICDRSVDPSLPALYFPDADEHLWTWTATPAADDTAGRAWGVYLNFGGSFRYVQSGRGHVRGVCAGQFSDFGLKAAA